MQGEGGQFRPLVPAYPAIPPFKVAVFGPLRLRRQGGWLLQHYARQNLSLPRARVGKKSFSQPVQRVQDDDCHHGRDWNVLK